MEVIVERAHPALDEYNVWVIETDALNGHRRFLVHKGDNNFEYVDVEPGGEAPVFMRVSSGLFMMLGRAFAKSPLTEPNESMAKHLEDTIEVRDKLLEVVLRNARG